MGMFNDLMDRIFHATGKAEAPKDVAKDGKMPESRVSAAIRQGVPVEQAVPGAAGKSGPVDIAATLDSMAAAKKEKLDWKHSIVDLMKLVGMDSSMSARKALAADLKYTGDTNDSATMNIWLHKEVMKKLAANGGKVPAELVAR